MKDSEKKAAMEIDSELKEREKKVQTGISRLPLGLPLAEKSNHMRIDLDLSMRCDIFR